MGRNLPVVFGSIPKENLRQNIILLGASSLMTKAAQVKLCSDRPIKQFDLTEG
jgi:hypothetical protein